MTIDPEAVPCAVPDSPPGALVAELRFPAHPARLKHVRALVRRSAADCGCDEMCIHDLVIAIDEACQNIIRHAYAGRPGDIVLTIRHHGPMLVVRLVDFALPVDVSRIHPRPLDELRPGGLGTHFIREVMDEVCFLPPPPGAGNLLQMTKRISPS